MKTFSKKPLITAAKYLTLVIPLALGIAFKGQIKRIYTAMNAPTTEQMEALIEQGSAAYKQGNASTAIQSYVKALKTNSQISRALLHLGVAVESQKKYEEALNYFKAALAIEPGYLQGYLHIGLCLNFLGKHDQALTYFSQVIKATPNNFDAHLHISKTFSELEQWDQALEHAALAVNLQPTNRLALLNVAYIYNKKGDLEKAVEQYKKVLAINPNFDNALYNLGYSLKLLGKLHEAIPYFEKAIALRPDYIDAHIALSHAYWFLGDFEKAWREYEWRWKMHGIDLSSLNAPMWDGIADIKGKTVLLFCEQGLGDTLQFIRFAKSIKERGANIICKIQKPLVSLLANYPYVDKFVTDNAQAGKFDYYAPLMSMPGILKTTPKTIPVDIPYLKADAKLVKYWHKKLEKDKQFKIGLCWFVDQIHEIDKSPIAKRSVPVELFTPLSTIANVIFYSLQKGSGEDQLKNIPDSFNLVTFGPQLDNAHGRFMDTAAIIQNLDLVITVDTVTAHLAAAMGKETWVLLPYAPDCRFGLGCKDIPWYPKTMTLFRQTKPFEWTQVIQEIKTALQKKLNSKTPRTMT